MLNFKRILPNLMNLRKIRLSHMTYQFKTVKPVYYPNRQAESQRMQEQSKGQLVAEVQKPKKYPRDYYYKLLGVKNTASVSEIKAAFYGIAKRMHPDATQQTRESKQFAEMTNAYNVLTDETKRVEYDQVGSIKDEQDFFRNKSYAQLSSMHRKANEIPLTANRDVEFLQIANAEPRLELSFVEAALGVKKKTADLRFLKKCPACMGQSPKMVNRMHLELCRKCNGTGRQSKKTATYMSMVPCEQCLGKRYINRNQCETCDNRGIITETVKVAVPVPPGVKTGDYINIDNPKTKQKVKYRVQVLDSDYFRRDGYNLHSDKYISISQAVLGGTVKVRGLCEFHDVKLDAGTDSHTPVVLKGKGIKTPTAVGDHIVTFKVRVPKNLTIKQRQLLLALAKTEDPEFASSD